MQLDPATRPTPLRSRLSAAAWMLLAAGMPSARAHADPAPNPNWQFDGSGLLYGEQGRVRVVEPIARITRLFASGQTLSAQLGLDAITGATPSGALPSGQIQTTTSTSGRTQTLPAAEIPVSPFKDLRKALDLAWQRPIGPLAVETGAHYSTEKDYRSKGGTAKLSLELMHRLTTVSIGGGINQDAVDPIGGTPVGASDTRTILTTAPDSKRVNSGMIGVSRIITRRWMMSLNATRTEERGYLTEPYKIVSLMDPLTGVTVGSLTENRPSTRNRMDLLTSSVYHLTDDVLYVSYRYYWDDWNLRSHTLDLKYRHELEDGAYVQPHARIYTQTRASFFHYGIVNGDPTPQYLSSDERLGPLNSVTLGATYGWKPKGSPGEWSFRAEYIRQFGTGYPGSAIGVQREINLMPPVSIGTAMVVYTVQF